jgi:hypothetical protein
MIRINNILDKLTDGCPGADVDVVERAYVYSAQVHAGQVRLSGEPYLMHPLEVANILVDMRLDPISVASGLLHDVLEDTRAKDAEAHELAVDHSGRGDVDDAGVHVERRIQAQGAGGLGTLGGQGRGLVVGVVGELAVLVDIDDGAR